MASIHKPYRNPHILWGSFSWNTEQIHDNTAFAVVHTLDSRTLEELKTKPNIHPQWSLRTTLRGCCFEEKNGEFPFFSGKSIVDIGWGFGGTPWILSNAKSIRLVDPIFLDNIPEQIERNLKMLHRDISFTRWLITKNEQRFIPVIQRNLDEKLLVLEELEQWHEKRIPPHIELDGSFGESIHHIPDDSVDVVFCNYVLSKTAAASLILSQALRILSPNGVIMISDNYSEDERESLSSIFAKMGKIMKIYREDTKVFAIAYPKK